MQILLLVSFESIQSSLLEMDKSIVPQENEFVLIENNNGFPYSKKKKQIFYHVTMHLHSKDGVYISQHTKLVHSNNVESISSNLNLSLRGLVSLLNQYQFAIDSSISCPDLFRSFY